jgi:oligoribonuclease (3'-5' exoribonuclease)
MSIPTDHILCLCDFETTGVDAATDHPIEVGMILLNHRLETLAECSTLIRPEGLHELADYEANTWRPPFDRGFAYHKIGPREIGARGIERTLVALDIATLVRCALDGSTDGKGRAILTSDNIQFEWQFMKRVFAGSGVHYCGWDTSLLLEVTGVGDPPSMKHRALDDCHIMLDALRDGVSRVNVMCERCHEYGRSCKCI